MPVKGNSLLRRIAGACSSSFWSKKGRQLWELNSQNFAYPMSKWDKLWCGGYIILKDYAAGLFPPQFKDQAEAYQNEIEYHVSLPGIDSAEVFSRLSSKPFWDAGICETYLKGFTRIYQGFLRHEIKPGQRLLELGCGSGWMAEFFAMAGYSVIGTTISPHDVAVANKKVAAIKAKELKAELEFRACPMESVDEIPDFRSAFDGVYVFEALHHAYDWRKALQAAAAVLKAGGWLLLANEPNRL